MADELIQDAGTADSSPAEISAPTPPAANAETPPAEAQLPFHEHPRWQQLMRERGADRQQIGELTRQLQQFQRTQQQASQPQATAEQQAALQALRQLQQLDPESARQSQRMDAIERALQTMAQQQQTSLTTQGRGQLSQMATEAGLPTDAKSLSVIENAVTVFLADNPEAVQRFRNGDLSVLKDSFAEFDKTFVSKLRRDQTAQTAQTKQTMLRTVPPRQVGNQSGAAALPKLEPGREREYQAAINKSAGDMWERLTKG